MDDQSEERRHRAKFRRGRELDQGANALAEALKRDGWVWIESADTSPGVRKVLDRLELAGWILIGKGA